jgi:hypothetical protein
MIYCWRGLCNNFSTYGLFVWRFCWREALETFWNLLGLLEVVLKLSICLLPGAPPPFAVSSALPPSSAILVEMLEFSCALQASVISLPLLAAGGSFFLF